jgi:pyruvate,orthophosphate dikinase
VCLVGCAALVVNPDGRHCAIAGETFGEGDVISLDGHSGDVLAGTVQVELERPIAALAKLAAWRAAANMA